MFLNLKDFAPHSRRGGAVCTPPSRLSPIPPRFSAICDIRRKVRCFACLSAKVSEAERFAGDYSPTPPSLTCDAAGAGGRRKKRAPYHLPLQQSVFFWRGGKGYPKRFIKTIKPSLQIFLDVLPLPWYKLLKPGGAAPARLHGILCGYRKMRQPPKQGREACTLAVRLWYMRSQS